MKFNFSGDMIPTGNPRNVDFEVEYSNPVPTSMEEICCELVQYRGGQEVARLHLTPEEAGKMSEKVLLLHMALQAASFRVEATIKVGLDDQLASWMPSGKPA
jgi:hypothetical protein